MVSLVAVLFLWAFGVSSASAMSTAFYLENRSAEPIFNVYLSPVQSDGWGTDRLGNEVIMPGDREAFNPGTARGCAYDIRVVYKSKKTEERRRVDLCETDKVVFSGAQARAASTTGGSGGTSTARPSAPASYTGSTPLRCGSTVNCRSQSEVVQRMQLRWANFSRATHYGSMCLDAIQRIRTMHPAAYGDGNPGWVQPQMDVCNLK